MAWKVGEVLMASGPAAAHYSFSIQDQHGAPLLTFAYATRDEAQEAREAAIEMLQRALAISANGQFY
jgi:hypothetical protein